MSETVEMRLNKLDLGVLLVCGTTGFVVGFLQFLPDIVVYRDHIDFVSGIILGILNAIFFSLLGVGALLLRRYRFRNKKDDMIHLSSPADSSQTHLAKADKRGRELYDHILKERSQD